MINWFNWLRNKPFHVTATKKTRFFGVSEAFTKFFEAGSRIWPTYPGFQEDDRKRPKRTIPSISNSKPNQGRRWYSRSYTLAFLRVRLRFCLPWISSILISVINREIYIIFWTIIMKINAWGFNRTNQRNNQCKGK